MKLELKHLAPYLPYGLNVLHIEKKIMLIISGAYFKANTDKHFRLQLLNWDLKVLSNECKPILRPLSDLVEKDFKKMNINIDWYGLKEYLSNYENMSVKDYNYLLKNHFDIFGLIPKLAVDINTIK